MEAATTVGGNIRAVADLGERLVLATVELPASPDRVFRALASEEIVSWWVRPGVFDTRQWWGDVKVGGRWETSGLFTGRPYSLRGDYQEVEASRKLVHTYQRADLPDSEASTVSYLLDAIDGGTRVTLRHWGFGSPEACSNNCLGWETSFASLSHILQSEAAARSGESR